MSAPPPPPPAAAPSSTNAINYTSASTGGKLYFAYGSNLSPEQMSIRCRRSPQSGIPVAIVRLDGWKWIITERGYANIVELHAQPQQDASGSNVVAAADFSDKNDITTTVWGLVYHLSAEDEATLDKYEGCATSRNRNPPPNPDPNPARRRRKPHLQPEEWDYNKYYLPVVVTKWLQPPSSAGIVVEKTHADEKEDLTGENPQMITVLAYVDEERVAEGEIAHPYIGRMNRAIRQSVPLGIPQTWVDRVVRKWVPEGIEVDYQGYVGSEAGYEAGVPD